MSDKPAILFFGDPHGLSAACVRATLETRPQAIVLLGDLELDEPLDDAFEAVLDAGLAVHWIFGNHDMDGGPVTWGYLSNGSWNPRTARGALHGRVAEIAGIRVAGLGGVFRQRIWRPPEERRVESFDALAVEMRRMSPQNWLMRAEGMRDSIFPTDYDRLSKLRADILAVHEAPSAHRHGFVAIDELAYSMGARLIVHGHHHESYLAEHVETGLRVAGVGLAAAVDETGRQVVPSPQERPRSPRLSESGKWRRVSD